MRFLYWDDRHPEIIVSISPSNMEPITAPGRLPSPPKTAAINDLVAIFPICLYYSRTAEIDIA